MKIAPSGTANPPWGKGGRGGGRGGYTGRGYGGNKGNAHDHQQRTSKGPAFAGETAELEGSIFDLVGGSKQALSYTKSIEKLRWYLGIKTKGGAEIAQCIKDDLSEPKYIVPPDLASDATASAKRIHDKLLDKMVDRMDLFEQNRKTLYTLVWGQCAESVRARLEEMDGFDSAEDMMDGMALLRLLRSVMQNYQDKKYGVMAREEAKGMYRKFHQLPGQSPRDYHDAFKSIYQMLATNGAAPKPSNTTIAMVRKENDSDEEAVAAAAEAEMAMVFLIGASPAYHKVMDELANQFLTNRDAYPKTLSEAFALLSGWQDTEPNRGAGRDGMACANVGNGADGAEGGVALANKGKREKKDISCFACGATGHYSYETECPKHAEHKPAGDDDGGGKPPAKENKAGVTLTTVGITLTAEATGFEIHPDWLLLDNQANVDVFVNNDLLTNIRRAETSLTIHSTAGESVTDLVGDFNGYGTVWYHPGGIANILSLSRVAQKPGMVVAYDQNMDKFTLTKPDGGVRTFYQTNGLYVSKLTDGVVMLNTVAANKSKYTNADYERATVARKLQVIMGRPSTKELLRLVDNKLLKNCPVTREDIMAAEHIFGPDVGSLRGKTVRRAPHAALVAPVGALPIEIMARYRVVTLTADIMFVNKMMFLVTFSRNIRFGTVEKLGGKSDAVVLTALKDVVKRYRGGGFSVEMLMTDGEFESLRGDLAAMRVNLNTTARDEHVGDIERYIRTVKERTRATYNTLPFERMPNRMVIEIVYTSVFWLNSFPSPNGISDTLSPREIVLRQSLDYNRHCQLEFGTYVQTHEQHDNSMVPRTTGAIALRPTGNAQGGHFFMSLTTGRRLVRNNWTALPLPQDVIERLRDLANREQRSLAARQRTGPGLAFLNRNQLAFDDDDALLIAGVGALDDHIAGVNAYEEAHDDDFDDFDQQHDYDVIANDEQPELHNEYDADEAPPDAAEAYDAAEVPLDDAHAAHEEAHEANGVPLDDAHDEALFNEAHEAPAVPPEPGIAVADIDARMDADYGARTRDGMRNRRERDYSHLFGHGQQHVTNGATLGAQAGEVSGDRVATGNRGTIVVETVVEETDNGDVLSPCPNRDGDNTAQTDQDGGRDPKAETDAADDAAEAAVLAFIFAQVSMKKGLKLYGDKAEAAVEEELQQLHDRKVMMPVEADSLSYAEKKKALEYLMFLKEKRTGKIKGRGCADGRKQRVYTAKEEASSPTVSIESIMLTSVIDALEGRHVATADIPGAFMQADMDETVHMRLVGTMVELLLRIAPEYEQYVVIEGGQKVLYVLLLKALYGTMRAALLFWRKLTSKLQEWGFALNPYDPCVANKTIDGTQCTVLWHVDDLKISHVDRKAVDTVLGLLSTEFGNEAPLTVCHAKVHDYLGMRIDYTEPGKVKFTMFDYIDGMLGTLGNEMSGTAASPAANHLFDVNPNATLLDKAKAEMFHQYTAKLLFLCKRARPDIQTAVAFLTTRVKGPDDDDYKKLRRVMRYLRATKDMPLTLEADHTHVLKWWVDASFAVHPDMKGHTGGLLSMGKGAVYGTSRGHKMVTRSSTEAELVSLYDVLPQILWTRNFLDAQGYRVRDSVVHQDNKSTILLAENGRMSSSKRTRHLNIRYFFVTDCVKAKELSIKYCPTEEMVSDYFTKPLQGTLFRKMRDLIMNVDPAAADRWDHRSVLDDDVGSVS
jgi:Reverse transcriptase (RNA-dependent DNA polymerase)